MTTHTMTYSHGLLVPLTRSCGAHCTYCTFKEKGSPLLGFDQVEALIREHVNSGICEVVLTSGQSLEGAPEVRSQWSERGYSGFLSYVRDICQLVLENGLLPTLDIGPLTYAQLEEIAPFVAAVVVGVENVNPEFCSAIQTNKSIDTRLESLSDAGLLRLPVHTSVLVGLGESTSDRLATLDTIADIANRHGHVETLTFRCVVYGSDDVRVGVNMEELLKLLKHSRDVMPAVKRAIPFNSPSRWLDALASEVDDLGVVFEGYDGVDWLRPFPKLTEVERSLARRGHGLQPRFPLSVETFQKTGASVSVWSVLEDWVKKKEFDYYRSGRS